VIATICGRRSIRDGFTDAPVPQSVIDDVVRSGLAAPSSKNVQPWRIHVVTNRAILAGLAGAVEHAKGADLYVPIDPATGAPRPGLSSTVVESAEVLRSVALGLFVENRGNFSGGRGAVASAGHENRRSALVGYALEMVGLGACIENMWLAAHVHGLGGVFMGDVLIAEQTIRERLGMDGDPVGVLALGYSTGAPAPKPMGAARVVRHS